MNDEFGTSYTAETFVGTNFYKFFYAILQRVQESETLTSEIFIYLQKYFEITNESISRPVVTNQGLIDALEDDGFIASVKPMVDADAGKINICVDKVVDSGYWEDSDDYADDKIEVCTVIKNSTVAGAVTQGSEVESLTLTNGQSFDFKYALPNRIEALLKLTITLSPNNQVVVKTPDEIKDILIANIAERYRLGKNFEPERYFNIADDAPWASVVLLEWSDDGGDNWYSTVYEAEFDDLFVILLANLEVVEI